MDSPELKEFGANIARVFFVTRIGRKSKLFSQSDRAEADKCAIESYLTFFIVTVLFIIEEFAFNPFYIGASNLGRLLRRDHIYDS